MTAEYNRGEMRCHDVCDWVLQVLYLFTVKHDVTQHQQVWEHEQYLRDVERMIPVVLHNPHWPSHTHSVIWKNYF